MSGVALHEDDRIVVLRQPGESPKEAARRYIRRKYPGTGYYLWDNTSTTFSAWAPGFFDFLLAVE